MGETRYNPISEAFKSVKVFLFQKFMTNISLAAVQEVSGNMAKATDSKSVKADLEISYMYDVEIQEEDCILMGYSEFRP